MSRKVLSLPALVCALILPLAGASAARAASVAVNPRLDPIAGIPTGIDYTYDTGGLPLMLTIVTRPAGSPPCEQTLDLDKAVSGSAGTTYITPNPIQLSGNAFGDVPFTWPSAGAWRVCAWLYGQPAEAAAADLGRQVAVRAPNVTLTLDVRQVGANASGADVLLHAVGTTEAPGNLFAMALPDRQGPCPPAFSSDLGEALFAPIAGRAGAVLKDAFDERLTSRSRLSLRRWRICAYLQDGEAADSAIAVGSQLIDLVLKPTLRRKPKMTIKNATATCDGGRWAGRPKPKLSVTWLLGSTKVAKGKSTNIKAAWTGKRLACAVTAKSRLGAKTSKSAAQRV